MDVDPSSLYQRYQDWSYRLGGSRRSRHHVIPRCRWNEVQNFFREQKIRGIKRNECRCVNNENHAHWHHVFGIQTPLEIIYIIHQKKFDLRRLNIWQTIGWLRIFFDLDSKEACFQAVELKPKLITDPKTINYLMEIVIRFWSPKIYREIDFEELLILAALLW